MSYKLTIIKSCLEKDGRVLFWFGANEYCGGILKILYLYTEKFRKKSVNKCVVLLYFFFVKFCVII